MPPPPVPPREAALSPNSSASKAPRAQLLRARTGQQYKDYNSTGWSPYLADDPNQVGHRGVPVVVAAETITNNQAPVTQKRLAAPIEDITAFPALPPKMVLSEIEQKLNSNQIHSHPSGSSNMAGSGEGHVTRAAPAQTQQTGGNATPKLKGNEKPFGTGRLSIKKENRTNTPHGTVKKVIGAVSPPNLAAPKYLGDQLDVPTPTRPPSRQEAASNLRTVKTTFGNFNNTVNASRPGEPPTFQSGIDAAALRVPTKTLAADTLLAARGTIGAAPHQYAQSTQGISDTQHNTASQFATQQDTANYNVVTHQVSPPHSLLPLRSPPPQAGFVSPPHANVALRRPADLTGPPFRPGQASQYTNMGFGYADAGDAMTDKKSSRSNAPTPQQEPAGNPAQHQQTAEASQGYNPQAWGQPGFQSIGGFPQSFLAEGGYLPQDAEPHPRSFESAQRFQPTLSQPANLGENQASFASNSPSESSFMMQMPGAFEPYRSHRNVDALPPPSLAPDLGSSATASTHDDRSVGVPPGFEQHFAAIGMPAGQDLQKQTQVVPAFQPSQDYAGTHQITQEAQGLDPQSVGNGVSQPRELAAQALKISQDQDNASGIIDLPLIQQLPGFEENRASFSAAEAKNDSQTTIEPPSGFEPRHQNFVAPPPKESVTTQSRLGTSAPLQDITNSASNRTSELFDKSEAEPLYSEHTAPTTAYQHSINTSASSNPIPARLPSISSVPEASAQSDIRVSAPIDEQGVSGFNALSQAMGTRTFEAQQQHAAAHFDHNGSYVSDMEIADEYEQCCQEVPAHLEERFRNLVGDVIENVGFTKEDGLAMIAEARRQTRAIYPPRIVGGEHHASRHRSPRRPSAGETIRSPSPNRPSQTPLQHTQPQIKAPVNLPPVPGVIWKPSPYFNARPARAGDESVTAHLNRLLMVAAMDGYMPAHLTLFTDTSQAAFEKANPEYRCIMRSDHAYSKPYADWVRKNETKVKAPIAPPGLSNWMNMPGSAAWAATVDPRGLPLGYMAETSVSKGSQASEETATPSKPAQPLPSAAKLAQISRAVAQVSPELKIKDKQSASIVAVREENEETSAEEEAMIQKAIEVSLKESLPNVSTPDAELPELGCESLGSAPKETLRALSRESRLSQQSKLSAEAPPFQSPAVENVVPFTAGGSGGRSRSLKSSQALSAAVASATLRSISGASASSKAANVQPMGPQPAPAQYGRDIITKGGLASPTLTGRAMAFIADVPASVSTTAIRNVLNRYGKAINIEVNRAKKSAVAQFDTLAAFQAAVAANPHKIGNAYIRVQPRRPDAAASPAIKLGLRAGVKESADQAPLCITPALQPASKPVEQPVVKQELHVAWPNAPWAVPKAPEIAAEPKEAVKQAPAPIPISQSKPFPKSVVKLTSKAPRPRMREPSGDEEEAKPSVLLEPPKTPPKYRERFIAATPTSASTRRLLDFHSVGDQDKNLLALPDLGEVLENPPIVKKSARTSRRAVEKAAKRAKALLAKEARAEVAGSRLGMGKGVLEQIGALSEVETDASITDSETGKKIKKSVGPKKVVVKGIEVIPGVDINDNHGKDVHVDRSNIREKFVISRGQLKEVDLEKKRRKEEETAAMQQRAHKARAAEMKSRGKATSSLTDDWEDEEDRIAAAETAAQMQSRRGSSSGSVATGPPVLMALGADFDGWRTTIPRPTSSLAAGSRRGSSQERLDTAMSMQSDFSMASSALPMPFPSAPLPSAKDVPQFVEPAYVPPPLNRHIIAPAKPLSEIIATEAALRGGRLEDKSTDLAKLASTSSWAQLAAGGKSSGCTSADTSRRGSSEVIELRSRSTSSVGGRNLMSRFTKAPGAVQSIKYDTNADNKRTVYILGVPQSTALADISDSVSSGGFGAIYKIEFGVDADTGLRLAGILFRDAGEVVPGIHGTAWGAIGYYTALKNACDADYLKEYPLWPWPHNAPISVYLQEYPEEPLMLRMHHDSDAIKKGRQPLVTRHLCLVNKGKLHYDWHEEEMIAFCHASGVKTGNVQACCVHNFGNATLVFGSVEDAVMMRGKFLDKFKESKGMTVTYSTCPGEQQGPMQYKRDNVYLRHLESMGWDVAQEIEEGQYKEKKRRNSKWIAPTA